MNLEEYISTEKASGPIEAIEQSKYKLGHLYKIVGHSCYMVNSTAAGESQAYFVVTPTLIQVEGQQVSEQVPEEFGDDDKVVGDPNLFKMSSIPVHLHCQARFMDDGPALAIRCWNKEEEWPGDYKLCLSKEGAADLYDQLHKMSLEGKFDDD